MYVSHQNCVPQILVLIDLSFQEKRVGKGSLGTTTPPAQEHPPLKDMGLLLLLYLAHIKLPFGKKKLGTSSGEQNSRKCHEKSF